MHTLTTFSDDLADASAAEPAVNVPTPLGRAERGFCGLVHAIRAEHGGVLSAVELESRLIEIGFAEGARVEILHEGSFGRDPIAVRVNDATIALRRREAMAIHVRSLDDNS